MNGAGAGAWGNLFTAICTFTLAIFAWKNYKKGGKVSRRDWIFLGLAVLALILWFCSRSLAAASVILLSISSIFGAVPTLAKTWKKPKSENLYTWIMFFIQGICGMVATTKFDFVNLFRRCVVISINAAVIFTMIYRRRKNATLSEDEILANS
jgi:succinate dehydrogenase/fumarate reductase cytochrome b subunit